MSKYELLWSVSVLVLFCLIAYFAKMPKVHAIILTAAQEDLWIIWTPLDFQNLGKSSLLLRCGSQKHEA